MAIGFLPRPKRRVPHPAIQPRLLRLFRDAVVKAWEIILASPPPGFNLANANEVEVNYVLYATLFNEVLERKLVPGFNSSLFCVTPTPGLRAYDGKRLEKRPDLFIHLIPMRATAYPDVDGLFIECKPIDRDHALGEHYCDLGLRRFIAGEYAWAMREGMMVGYARSGYLLPGELTKFLTRGSRPKTIPLLTGPKPVYRGIATPCSQVPHVSTHSRDFIYMHSGDAAPEITIYHLWLSRS
jgi:hypothetical protein